MRNIEKIEKQKSEETKYWSSSGRICKITKIFIKIEKNEAKNAIIYENKDQKLCQLGCIWGGLWGEDADGTGE